ncbi:MAG TPA: argininosuccinate synthase, partial [Tepidisphaeraceae bacterium]|nr:argininosuccinate synthase [Tepidisphaeraceae bacterium]
LKIIAPWKDTKFELRDRESAVEYAEKHGVPIAQSKKKIYSQDRNLWHISHEGAEIEHPDAEPNWEACLTMTVPPEKAPDKAEILSVDFEAGTPIAVNGKKMAGDELIAELNKIGGKHGVGVTVLAENRLVGMKSRGVYETPGGTILYEAHKALEQICIERDTLHFKQQVALRYAELVYYGQWFHPLREGLQKFIDHTNATVTGNAKVRLYKGRAMQIGASSPHSLYDPQLASFSMEGYDVTAARGFIDLFGLPMKVASQKRRW